MAATVLSISQQKHTLSAKGKKNKKKVIKNVLGLPNNSTIEFEEVGLGEVQKLNQLLNRLLPLAKLPIQPNTKFKKECSNTDTSINESDVITAKSKRSQLSVGVNEVNKGLKKKIISAVLLANDIQPKFLVQHLKLLCNHSNIPFLALPKFRDLTKHTLGFPCIALGIKNNSNDFNEVTNEITNVFKNLKRKNTNEVVSSESGDEDLSDIEDFKLEEIEEPVVEFNYLYRSSDKERVFVPESDERLPKKTEVEFISISKDEEENKQNSVKFPQKKKKKKKNKMLSLQDLDGDVTNEETDVPKKKIKKDWVIDTVGSKEKFRYFSTNLIKTQSNPDRFKKKKK